MPAFFLLFRIKKVIIPLPWFLIWILLLPLVPIALAISPFLKRGKYKSIMKSAPLVWWLLAGLHGLKVDIDSKSNDSVYLSFM